jgi:hypothetical protein
MKDRADWECNSNILGPKLLELRYCKFCGSSGSYDAHSHSSHQKSLGMQCVLGILDLSDM